MNIRKTIQKRTISLVLAIMMAVSCTFNTAMADTAAIDSGNKDSAAEVSLLATANSDTALGEAQGYNLVCFGNFKNGGSDVEGKSAIGGNVNVNGSFTFGNGNSTRPISSGFGLVWGGTDHSNFNVSSGHTSATALVNESTLAGFRNYNSFGFDKYETWKDSGELEDKAGFKFSDLQDQLIKKSENITALSANCGTPTKVDASGELVFTGTDTENNVFTIKAEDLAKYPTIYLDTPSASTTIINVVGTDVTIPLVNVKGGNLSDATQIKHLLWNLSTATKVSNSKTNPIKGSVLAPNATFTPAGNSNYEGTLIVDSFNSSVSFEGHNFPFDGTIPGDINNSGELSLDKTSQLKNWDDRTYDIKLDVTAQSKIVSSTVPCDIVMVLDRSGSMAWYLYTEENSPKTSGVNYYIHTGDDQSEDSYTQIGYKNGNWQYNGTIIEPGQNGTGDYGYTTVNLNNLNTATSYYVQGSDGYDSVSYHTTKQYVKPSIKKYYYPANGWYTDDVSYSIWSGVDFNSMKRNPTEYQFYTRSNYPQYQFYTKSASTKLAALQAAANNFVNSVNTSSPDSRIGVVSFADGARIDTNLNSKKLLRVGNAASQIEIDRAINALSADGSTYADDGLQKAIDLYSNTNYYESVTTPSPRSKVVVFFTDGEPNHSSGFDQDVADVAISNANKLKAAPYNATVYSIGVFQGLTGSSLTDVETYMKDVASYKPKSTTEKQYYPVSGATSINDIFQTISNEAGGVTGTTVTDVIDPRFELTADSIADLKNDGATVTDTANDTQTIRWNDQPINVKKDADGNLLVSWEKTFTVKAKNEFIGGNAVPTNAAGSGVTYGNNQTVTFPQPTVNVKPKFYIGNAETTIFLGEEVPTTTLEPYTLKTDGTKVTGQQMYCVSSDTTGKFSYQWFKADGTTQIGTAQAFPAGQLPNETTSYVLKASFEPDAATTESNENSTIDNTVYTAGSTDNTIVAGSADGIYKVNVKTGKLTITKTFTGTAADSKQFFTFKIERFANTDTGCTGAVLATSYEVVYTANGTGSKVITNLPLGNYKVSEISKSAWRYTQQGDTEFNLGKYLGRNADQTTFTDSITAKVTNQLTNNKWISGQDSVTNVFVATLPTC